MDNIQGELLKYGEEVIEILHDVCNKILKTGIWPEDWTTTILIPIPKKASLKYADHRAIALISHASEGELHQLWSLCWMIVRQVLEQEEVQRNK